jgi:hypothetical protein
MKRISPAITFFLVLTISSNAVLVNAQSIKKSGGRAKVTPATFDGLELVRKYQQAISSESLAARLHYLASDHFEGRGTGARGQRMAAQYLASQYQQMGLKPAFGGVTSSVLSPSAYLQQFALYRQQPKESRLELAIDGSKVAESIFSVDKHDDLAYYSRGGAVNASGSVVFAGYGIADDTLGFNDYAALASKGISIDGKWLIILADEPLNADATSLFPTPERKLSRWTTGFVDKSMARVAAGRPLGVLIVNDLTPRNETSFADAAAAASRNAQRTGNLSFYDPSDITQTYFISAKFADQMLAPTGRRIADIKQGIDKSLKPNVFELKDVIVKSAITQNQKLDTENVLALIEGSDPRLKNEVVVVSSHYDHMGLNPLLKGDQIFNGAADDGSGTVATLELAQALMDAKRDGYGPRRSILFANFTGEEVGMFGSLFYTGKDPRFPLDQTIANINMDGVGGTDHKNPTGSKNYVYITGREGLSEPLLSINEKITRLTNSSLELTDGAKMNFSSDDAQFGDQFIPYIYYSTGRTEHYHTVNDTADTIDYPHMTRIVQLVLANIWQVANQTERIPSVDRKTLDLAGYSCLPCNLACDTVIHKKPGNCPFCGHSLRPKYVKRS